MMTHNRDSILRNLELQNQEIARNSTPENLLPMDDSNLEQEIVGHSLDAEQSRAPASIKPEVTDDSDTPKKSSQESKAQDSDGITFD